MRPSKYNAAALAPIVKGARSIADVLRALGLPVNGGNHRMISGRIRLAGIDTSHFAYRRGAPRSLNTSREVLAPLVETCTSIAQGSASWVCRSPAQGEPPRAREASGRRSLSDDAVFIDNGPLLGGPKLTPRLVGKGWPYRCASCEIVDWRGHPLVLHVDHINGINNDNRLVNLRFLCPNCHTQTETYCNRARELSACYTLSPTRAWRNWLTRWS